MAAFVSSGVVDDKINNEADSLRKLMRTPTSHEDPSFTEILQDLWSSSHDLIGTPLLESQEYDINLNDKEKLLKYLTNAGLSEFFNSLVKFGIESVEDLLDNDIVSNDTLLTYTDMKSTDIDILREYINKKTINNDHCNERNIFSPLSQHWIKIGFQSENPEIEFRSVGMLGACCVSHVIKNHPSSCAMVLRSQIPLAAACINLNLMIANEIFGGFKNDFSSNVYNNNNDTSSASENDKSWWTSLTSSSSSSPISSNQTLSTNEIIEETRKLLLLPQFTPSSDSEDEDDDDAIDPRLLAMYTTPSTNTQAAAASSSSSEQNGKVEKDIEKASLAKLIKDKRLASCGFVGIHGVALHVLGRISLDISASIMDFAHVLKETKKELNSLLGIHASLVLKNKNKKSSSSSSAISDTKISLDDMSFNHLWTSPPLSCSELWDRARMIPSRKIGQISSISRFLNMKKPNQSQVTQSGKIWCELSCGTIKWYREIENSRHLDIVERTLLGNFEICPTARITVDRLNTLSITLFNKPYASSSSTSTSSVYDAESGGIIINFNHMNEVDQWAVGMTEHVAMLNLIHKSNYYKTTGQLPVNSSLL